MDGYSNSPHTSIKTLITEGAQLLGAPFLGYFTVGSTDNLLIHTASVDVPEKYKVVSLNFLLKYFHGANSRPLKISITEAFQKEIDDTFIHFFHFTSICAIQVVHQSKVVGLLVIGNSEKSFSESTYELLEVLSTFISNALNCSGVEVEFENEYRKYKAVFDHAKNGVFLLNNNTILDVNPMACQMFGMSRELILGKTTDELSPKNYSINGEIQHSNILGFAEKTLSGESQRFEWIHQKNDGTLFPAEISLSRIQGIPECNLLAIVNDISIRKAYENQLIQAREEAHTANRLKSASLASMSHEIRTPLNSIIGFSDLLLDEEATAEEKDIYTKLIMVAGKSLLQLVADIIDVSKIEAGQVVIHKEKFHLNAFLHEIYNTFLHERYLREKDDIELRVVTALSDELVLDSDPLRLRQIFNNLITNALKFVDAGFIEFGYSAVMSGNVLFYVKDSGIGIEKSHQNNIFSQYGQDTTTLKRNSEGSGLGLSISKSFVELLGGKIWIDSERGSGSVFYFTIPYHEDQLQTSKTIVEKEIFPVDLKGKKVLIVDDINDNCLLLQELFKGTHAEVLVANNGNSALNIVRAHQPVSLVLLDIRMPEMDGYEAAKKLREEFPSIVIIALTAYSSDESYEKCMALGCNGFLTKPLSVHQLHDLLVQYFD